MPAPYPASPPKGILNLRRALQQSGITPDIDESYVPQDLDIANRGIEFITGMNPETGEQDPWALMGPAWKGPLKDRRLVDLILGMQGNPNILSNAHAALEIAKARYPRLMSVPYKINILKDKLIGKFGDLPARSSGGEVNIGAGDYSIKDYVENIVNSAIGARFNQTGKIPNAYAKEVKRQAGEQVDIFRNYITPKDQKSQTLEEILTKIGVPGITPPPWYKQKSNDPELEDIIDNFDDWIE